MIELIFLGLAIMLAWGFGDFIMAYISKKGNSPFLLNFWGSVVSLAVVSVVYFAFFFPKTVSGIYWLIVFASSIVVVLSFICFYKAVAVGKVSLISPITSSYGILSMFLGLFFLKESLSRTQYIGIFISTIGLLLAVLNISELRRLKISSQVEGLKYAVFTFVLWGINFTLSAVLVKGADWVTPFFFSSIFSVPLSYAILRRAEGKMSLGLKRETFLLFFVAGILLQAGALVFTFSLNSFPSALLAPISAGYPAVIIILAHFFFRERIAGIQYAGVVLILAGLAVAAV